MLLIRDCDPGNLVLPLCPLEGCRECGWQPGREQGGSRPLKDHHPSVLPPACPPSPAGEAALGRLSAQGEKAGARPRPADGGGNLQQPNSQLLSGSQTVSKTLAWLASPFALIDTPEAVVPCCFCCRCCAQISHLDSNRLLQETFPLVHFVSSLVADASNILRGHLFPFFPSKYRVL